MHTVLITVCISLQACSPASRLNVLTFFFDGVPVSETSATDEPNSKLAVYVTETESEDTLSIPFRTQIIFHEPYQNKECNQCHNSNIVGKLIDTEPALCYLCHNDFSIQYSSLHGPVDAGFCSSCHDPHKSEQKFLLLKPGNELCFTCHAWSEDENIKAHEGNMTSECISCHNPHGTNQSIIKAIPVGR